MVVVTGATGHLGTVLVRMLVESGETVRYLARRGSPAPGLDRIQAERVDADLSDVEALTAAFAGASVVYHAAARISIAPGDREELHRVNVAGTDHVIEAARRARVGRLLNVSSIEAFPLEDRRFPVTEDQEIDPDRTTMEYGRTKALAMQAVLEAASDGLDAVTCCPTAFIGPPDYRRSPMGQLVFDYLHHRLPAYVNGGFDFVDVRDVATGIIAAAHRGASGSVYLLSGRHVAVPELMGMLETITGVRKPRICLPTRAVLPLVPIVEAYYRATGRAPRFTRYSLHLLTLGVRVSAERARTELGYAARPLEDTLSDLAEWYRATGMAET